MKHVTVGLIGFLGAATLVAGARTADGRDDVGANTGGAALSVPAGATRVIDETLRLSALDLADGAKVAASAGHSLTMTVGGTTVAIKPGHYVGDIVLTPTENVAETFADMGVNETYLYRAALYIDDGARVAAKSVAAAVVGGSVTDSEARDISITSDEDKFNGIIVTGHSTYTITNPKIHFTGNGGNDFRGFGAAIKAAGDAKLTVDHAAISNTGVVRTAVFVDGHSTVHVNNSVIEVRNGTLPADYQGGPITGRGGVMMEPPWVLGVAGNVRATNVVAYGTAYYNHSRVKAQGWGALSTDATKDVRLYASDSVIETVESGYGAYADGKSLDTFRGCTFKVADYGLIMTGGSGVFTDRSVVSSGRFGVMMHSGGSGTLTIDKGSAFHTKEAVIQIKSSFPSIFVDRATLESANGLIVEAVVNDDPYAGAGPGHPPGGGPPGGGPPGDTPHAGAPPPAAAPPTGPKLINASFSHVNLHGDILNAMTTLAGMTVRFRQANITGAISTATAEPVQRDLSAKTYGLIGKMTHTLGGTAAAHGLDLSLGPHSTWVVDRTSYLTGLKIAGGAVIKAPAGQRLVLTVDGRDAPLRPGAYHGAVVLAVSRS